MFQLELTRLKELLHYDPSTGLFKRIKRAGRILAGATAGCIVKHHGNLYSRISVDNQNIFAHRLAWFYTYGTWPDQIDHIDGNGLNNSLTNLRNVDALGNARNKRLSRNNTSKVCGVHYHKRFNKWYASIRVQGKRINLGSFINKEEAIKVRQAAETKYNFHPNHGKRKAVFLVN